MTRIDACMDSLSLSPNAEEDKHDFRISRLGHQNMELVVGALADIIAWPFEKVVTQGLSFVVNPQSELSSTQVAVNFQNQVVGCVHLEW